ncbi:bola-like protein [Nadsonia fulvescens var. elongata DSM 6958]|uniref:Bola-like protein n=1 Tax=Nadsonia fulvescens var. elongata DSM 6958 TaxID=857566 RepID=A0A1E3PQ65_9ASCO|nr:bola-like protein [Nadsonia fulvescens var. elongata DSM 6958]
MSSAPLTNDYLDSVIRERLGAVHTQITDVSGGCGQAFEVIIISPQFSGKNTLMRHRMVNKALKEEIAGIHAFTQKDFTPEEWEKNLKA